jgi:hypothetical protein
METEENDRDRQNNGNRIPPEVRAEVHFPDSVEAQHSADQKSQHTTQKLIAAAAWSAFFAALLMR